MPTKKDLRAEGSAKSRIPLWKKGRKTEKKHKFSKGQSKVKTESDTEEYPSSRGRKEF